MAETFRTVGGRGEARFEVRGSEFVGHVAPVADVEEAEAFVASVREQYDDATHNVPAYRVRRGERGAASPPRNEEAGSAGLVREYESDAGEPSGSSGGPALNILQQRELLNVAAVVTRYYGGTNLGVGGLARAYGRAVKEAVDDAGVVQRRPHETLSVTVDYDDSGTVRGVLESEGHEFDADYGERVGFEVRVPLEESDALRDRLASATSGRAELG
jgi:uncharacterized YigZ family protein